MYKAISVLEKELGMPWVGNVQSLGQDKHETYFWTHPFYSHKPSTLFLDLTLNKLDFSKLDPFTYVRVLFRQHQNDAEKSRYHGLRQKPVHIIHGIGLSAVDVLSVEHTGEIPTSNALINLRAMKRFGDQYKPHTTARQSFFLTATSSGEHSSNTGYFSPTTVSSPLIATQYDSLQQLCGKKDEITLTGTYLDFCVKDTFFDLLKIAKRIRMNPTSGVWSTPANLTENERDEVSALFSREYVADLQRMQRIYSQIAARNFKKSGWNPARNDSINREKLVLDEVPTICPFNN